MIKHIFIVLLASSPAMASFTDHFTGTSLNARWTASAAGNGDICVNGTKITSGSQTCTPSSANKDFVESIESTTAGSAAIFYRAFDKTKDQIIEMAVETNVGSAEGNFFWIHNSSPAASVPTPSGNSIWSSSSVIRMGFANSQADIRAEYFDSGGTRRWWDTTAHGWVTSGSDSIDVVSTGNTYRLIVENDATNNRLRMIGIGRDGGGTTDEHQGEFIQFQTSWLEWGVDLAQTPNDNLYLVFGSPWTDADSVVHGRFRFEYIRLLDGGTLTGWVNARTSGASAWASREVTGYKDDNGLPQFFVHVDSWTDIVPQTGCAASHAKDHMATYDPETGLYYLVYSCSDGAALEVGMSTSTSVHGPWSKVNSGNSIIGAVAGSSRAVIYNPWIVKDLSEPDRLKRWKIMATGTDDSSANFFLHMFYSSAPATTAWTFDANNPVLSPQQNGIDKTGYIRSVPFQYGGLWYYYAAGKDSTDTGGSSVVSYTFGGKLESQEYSGKVLLSTASTNCNTSLTGAVGSTTTVNVSDTTGCNRDQVVIIDDDTTVSNYVAGRIKSVRSSTQLDMYSELDANSGALLRGKSAFYRMEANQPIYIQPTNKFYFIGTCFHAFPDQAGVAEYYETTCMASSTRNPEKAFSFEYLMDSPATRTRYGGIESYENLAYVNPIPPAFPVKRGRR